LASIAGYGPERELYKDAASTSFGCGAPLAFAGVQPGQTVLDLGSGAGFDLLIASDIVGPSGLVLGVDMTDEMLATASANVKNSGKANIDLRRGIIEELPVADSSVDWVISNCVINLSPDKPAVFREIFRVLKPGGRFSISDIVAQNIPDDVRESAQAYAACVAGALSETQYLDGLKEAGFIQTDVVERLIYTAEQMRAMLGGILPETAPAGVGRDVLDELAGNVWSAKFTGTKPE
jgi:SAM-dependent methyltransferase